MRFTKFIEYRRHAWVPWVNLFAGTAHNPGGAQCPGEKSRTQFGRVVVVATGVTPHCQPEQMPPLLGCLDQRRG